MVKNPAAIQETQVQSLDQEDPLKEEMATYSSILARESHGQGSLMKLQSIGSQRDGHN